LIEKHILTPVEGKIEIDVGVTLRVVSAKREYPRSRPETFGDFHLKIGEPGVRRRNRMREKPGFPGHSRASWGSLAERMNGWLRRKDSNLDMAS
jgi:hypothetical protein